MARLVVTINTHADPHDSHIHATDDKRPRALLALGRHTSLTSSTASYSDPLFRETRLYAAIIMRSPDGIFRTLPGSEETVFYAAAT